MFNKTAVENFIAKFDVKIVGKCPGLPFRVAASATRGYYGEPVIVAPTYTSGVSNVNTIVVLTDDLPVIGTDQFVGILAKDMDVNSAGTVLAHRTTVAVPRANETRIRAKVTTASTADTQSEAIGLLWDIYVFDLITSVYTFKPAADTGGFTARWFNYVKSQLDCVADARALTRVDITS